MITEEGKRMHAQRISDGRLMAAMLESEAWTKQVAPFLKNVEDVAIQQLIGMEPERGIIRCQERIKFVQEFSAQMALVIKSGEESERIMEDE